MKEQYLKDVFLQGSVEGDPFWDQIRDQLLGQPSNETKACHEPKPVLFSTGEVRAELGVHSGKCWSALLKRSPYQHCASLHGEGQGPRESCGDAEGMVEWHWAQVGTPWAGGLCSDPACGRTNVPSWPRAVPGDGGRLPPVPCPQGQPTPQEGLFPQGPQRWSPTTASPFPGGCAVPGTNSALSLLNSPKS